MVTTLPSIANRSSNIRFIMSLPHCDFLNFREYDIVTLLETAIRNRGDYARTCDDVEHIIDTLLPSNFEGVSGYADYLRLACLKIIMQLEGNIMWPLFLYKTSVSNYSYEVKISPGNYPYAGASVTVVCTEVPHER